MLLCLASFGELLEANLQSSTGGAAEQSLAALLSTLCSLLHGSLERCPTAAAELLRSLAGLQSRAHRETSEMTN